MMMKTILFEYMTGGGLCNQTMPKLAHEGGMMLQTIGQGLSAIDEMTLITMRDARLSPPPFDTEVVWVNPGDDFSMILSDILNDADAFWPIAPETNGTLSTLCCLAESHRCLLLNPSAYVVNQFSSKLNTYRYMSDHQINCVNTMRLSSVKFPHPIDLVIKPDDGVGCEKTVVIRAGDTPSEYDDTLVCQPLIKGIAGSIGVIYSQKEMCLVSVNQQNMVLQENKFSLQSCIVNGLWEHKDEAFSIAKRLHSACPDLCGYIGIDFILTISGMVVLELNPRVTTSFVGLPQSIDCNPCQLVVDAATGQSLNHPSQNISVEILLDD